MGSGCLPTSEPFKNSLVELNVQQGRDYNSVKTGHRGTPHEVSCCVISVRERKEIVGGGGNR